MTLLETLIRIFRKEAEDLGQSNVKKIFNAFKGDTTLTAGETITITVDTAYDSVSDYAVRISQALDSEGTNIIDAIVVTPISATQFSLYSPLATTVKWESVRRLPKFEYWT